MQVAVTDKAEDDLAVLPRHVEETFFSKIETVETNLRLGAEPGQAFDKYLSGNLHPLLQMNLGRDYRAWFIEGRHLPLRDEDGVYALRVLTKKRAEELSGKITDVLAFARSFVG